MRSANYDPQTQTFENKTKLNILLKVCKVCRILFSATSTHQGCRSKRNHEDRSQCDDRRCCWWLSSEEASVLELHRLHTIASVWPFLLGGGGIPKWKWWNLWFATGHRWLPSPPHKAASEVKPRFSSLNHLHGIAWSCMVLLGLPWYCTVLHGTVWIFITHPLTKRGCFQCILRPIWRAGWHWKAPEFKCWFL